MAEVEQIYHSPRPLKEAWSTFSRYLLVPVLMLVITSLTVKYLALVGIEWQWTLAKWSYPLLCVAAALVLIQYNHWTVKSIVQYLVPAMVLVATISFTWKHAINSEEATSKQLTQMAERIQHADEARKSAETKVSELQAALNLERLAHEASKEPPPPPAEPKPEPRKSARHRPAPTPLDFSWWVP